MGSIKDLKKVTHVALPEPAFTAVQASLVEEVKNCDIEEELLD